MHVLHARDPEEHDPQDDADAAADHGVGQEGSRGAVPVEAVTVDDFHVHDGQGVDVGVVVHSRPADYLGVRVVSDPAVLGRMVGDVDVALLARYLDSCAASGP